MDKNKKFIKEYVRTFTITFIVVVVIVLSIMTIKWYMLPQTLREAQVSSSTEELDYYLIDFLIEKNAYLLSKYPKNYGYNIRLGTLYSIKRDYESAEKEFKVAVEKSPYTAYRARYKLATLYIKLNRLSEAQKLMDEITDKADKKLINHKGEIYKQIGNKLYNEGYYLLATMKLEKAIFYFKRSDKKQLRETRKELALAYTAVGDMYVEQEMPEDAIEALERANELSDSPEINYKLALLHIDKNPSLAVKYLEPVLKEAPEMMNYYMYYDLLMKLSEIEEELGNKAAKELFEFKANKFKQYVKEEILNENDILMDVTDIKMSHNAKKQKLYIKLYIRLRNNSPFDVDNLSIELIFKEKGHSIHKFNKPIFAYENIFPMGQQTPVISLETDLDVKNLDKTNDIIEVYVYLYKKENHKKLLRILPVKKSMDLFEYKEQ